MANNRISDITHHIEIIRNWLNETQVVTITIEILTKGRLCMNSGKTDTAIEQLQSRFDNMNFHEKTKFVEKLKQIGKKRSPHWK